MPPPILPPQCQANELDSNPTSAGCRFSIISEDGPPMEDEKPLTSGEKRAIYLTCFAATLKDDGLRSPAYYRDKSPFMSFENAPPAVMGILKATRLRKSYIEAEDLIERLHQLETSESCAPRYYRHPGVSWDMSPAYYTPNVMRPGMPNWCHHKLHDISCLRRKLGLEATEYHQNLVRARWDKVRDIRLAPVPDSHLLKHINHCPSGTLFPRYLVKGLHALREHADGEGCKIYSRSEEEAESKRNKVIDQWTKEHPDSP